MQENLRFIQDHSWSIQGRRKQARASAPYDDEGEIAHQSFQGKLVPFPLYTQHLIILDLQRGVLCLPWRDLQPY